MKHTLSTSEVRPSERFDYWYNTICDLYAKVKCDSDSRQSFNGNINWHQLGESSISLTSADPLCVSRTPLQISRSSTERFVISIQVKGRCSTEQGNRVSMLEPGEIILLDSSRPFNIIQPDEFEQIVVSVNKQALLNRIPNTDLLAGKKISHDNHFGKLIGNFCSELVDLLGTVSDQAEPHLEATVLDLMAAGFASTTDAAELEMSRSNAVSIMRIKSFVKSRIRDPHFGREDIAEHMGLSIRQINKIFEAENTSSARYIRKERLKLVCQNLRDLRLVNKTITDVAFDAGFENIQHFSRIFRQEFNMSPREYRNTYLRQG